jgi:hypothetical protein
MAPHRFSATACHHLAATGTGRDRIRTQWLAIDRSWAAARESFLEGTDGGKEPDPPQPSP